MKTLGILLATVCCASTMHGQAASFGRGGTYSGLFYEAEGYWQQSSGLITITTTSTGKHSGKMQIGPQKYSFSGQFDTNGVASVGINRGGRNPLLIEMQLDSQDPDLITGTIQDGIWTADMYADRMVYDGKTSICPDAGLYTAIIPGDFNSTTQPAGDCFATIKVDNKGKLKAAVTLADGTKFTQSSTVSKGGLWPLYANLYQGGGTIYSWLLLNKSQDEQLSGDVIWIKPAIAGAKYYPDGFAILLSAYGSRYQKPAKGQKILDLTEAAVEFIGGNLSESFTNHVSLDSNNHVVNFSQNKLSMSFNLGNGSFTGKVQDPNALNIMLPFRGVVLQNYGVAAGFFSDWTRTGEIWMEPW